VKFFVTEKVEIKNENNLPIFLLNKRYPEKAIYPKDKNFHKQIEDVDTKFQVHFNSLIWLCYRRNFQPLLVGEEEQLVKWLKSLPRDIGR
jgi:DNA replication protein DnaD